MREVIRAGVLVRQKVRNMLWQLSIPYEEQKGWLESNFYVDVTEDQYETLKSVQRLQH